jgi:transposase
VSALIRPEARVFVYSQAIDMRSGFGKLQSLVAEAMKANLFEGNLFVFLGRNPRRAKLLLFDGTGLVLITKRLDRGAFMPIADLCETGEISQDELGRLLDGANLRVVFAARKRAREGQEVA